MTDEATFVVQWTLGYGKRVWRDIEAMDDYASAEKFLADARADADPMSNVVHRIIIRSDIPLPN